MRWLEHFLFGGTLHGMGKESQEYAESQPGVTMNKRHDELQSFHRVLYDAVGQVSPGLSEEAFSTLCSDARSLELNSITLNFRDSGVEAEFQQHVAVRRRPVLLLVFCFDVFCYLFRMAVKFSRTGSTIAALMRGICPQLCNMLCLYCFLGLLNRRSRRLGNSAARQEEFMLTGVMTLAICSLLATINQRNPQDYVYAAMFMISTTCFLKIQWLVGTVFMMLPLAVTYFWHKDSNILPTDAMVHLAVSWAVGGFMAYLSDTYRRQMFVNHRLAKVAAEKELQEAQARIDVQQQLAAAQTQAAQRAITVAREKAANEAKSEFMSLMCHEVRTPLNGCLASAEMLLEMPLQEEQRELAKTIRVSGSILLSTVSNFLDFFKMEAGKQLDVVRTEMTTKDLVGDIHCIIEATIGRSSEVLLEKPNTDGVPDYVLGDPDRLRGILLNLYTNAAKFTKRGSIALRVRVASKDYRPKPSQVIEQQKRGPFAVWHGNAAPTKGGPQHSAASWGVITGVLRQRGGSDSEDREHSFDQADTSDQRAKHLTDAPEPALSRYTQGRAEGPGADAAADALRAVQRGHDAHNAAEAVDSTHDFTTPVACEHTAGQALLQHAVGTIDRAADKLQVLAGLDPVVQSSGHNMRRLHQLPPVHEVSSDHNPRDSEDSDTSVSQSKQQASQLSPMHASKQADIEALRQGSCSGRISSNSVLDQAEDSSSAGSSPAMSTAESDLGRPADYTLDTVHVTRAGPPQSRHRSDDAKQSPASEGRHSGASRSNMGERTRSNPDVTDHASSSGASRRESSSGSFSDYLPPLRRSMSTPVDSLDNPDESADVSGNEVSSGGQRTAALTAASYNGMSSGKATLAKGVATTVQDLGDGWFNTVAHRKAPVLVDSRSSSSSYVSDTSAAAPKDTGVGISASPFQQSKPESAETDESTEWLVFEVTDTGCGISQRGLASLFTEYVQGTEDDMKRPRTRGGTGLGLSICSKQVSVLGGMLGAMSKVGEGSTFWFTIPLIRPAQPNSRASISMRRTASWGSRDAFTDGHLSSHADAPVVPPGRRTLAATSKAHRSKRAYSFARYSRPQAAQHSQDPGQRRSQSMDRPTLSREGGWGMPQRPLASAESARRMSAPEAPPDRRGGSDERPRVMRTAASDDSLHANKDRSRPNADVRAAVAHAVLSTSQAAVKPQSSQQEADCKAHNSQTRRQRPFQQIDGHIGAKFDGIQRNLLAPYEGTKPKGPAHLDRGSNGMSQSLEALPEGKPFQAPSTTLMQDSADSGSPEGPHDKQTADHTSPSRQLIRPSMEARRRRLDLSALQGRLVLLAEDNLINQRVAKMMLASLGMTVEVVSNGQEAVEAAKRRIEREGVRQFDVLLMDMAMPVMGGVDATKEIRRLGGTVPIVAMTANSSDRDRDECLESGMDGFLSKPVLKDRLAEAILSAVSGRRQFQDKGTISLKAYERL